MTLRDNDPINKLSFAQNYAPEVNLCVGECGFAQLRVSRDGLKGMQMKYSVRASAPF
jgi:hypothetical protein